MLRRRVKWSFLTLSDTQQVKQQRFANKNEDNRRRRVGHRIALSPGIMIYFLIRLSLYLADKHGSPQLRYHLIAAAQRSQCPYFVTADHDEKVRVARERS
jgi:hypothetical protein